MRLLLPTLGRPASTTVHGAVKCCPNGASSSSRSTTPIARATSPLATSDRIDSTAFRNIPRRWSHRMAAVRSRGRQGESDLCRGDERILRRLDQPVAPVDFLAAEREERFDNRTHRGDPAMAMNLHARRPAAVSDDLLARVGRLPATIADGARLGVAEAAGSRQSQHFIDDRHGARPLNPQACNRSAPRGSQPNHARR